MSCTWRRPIAARPRAWVLGSAHPRADRSFAWGDPFPNFSDPDILIVNLTTLTAPILERIDKEKLAGARESIMDKYYSRGIIVVITQPNFSIYKAGSPQSNYCMLPIELQTKGVPRGRAIMWGNHEIFRAYRPHVRHFSFHIESHDSKLPRPPFAMLENVGLFVPHRQGILDRSQHYLGAMLTVSEWSSDGRRKSVDEVGQLVLLPPPTGPIDEAIGAILSVYKPRPPAGAPPAGAPPTWAEQLRLGPASRNTARIEELEGLRAEMQGEIDELARQNVRIRAHRRLLYSNGPELEDAVVEAFRALGFDDIERMGNADEEDASFGMGGGSGTRYSRCAIEAKGTGKGTQMQHILQCGGWARRRAAAENKPTKGVLVPNQHRHKPYPESQEIRTMIEDNQREQAELDDICIIPSCALYEAVARVLDGEAPDRAKIVAKIAATRGVLADVL